MKTANFLIKVERIKNKIICGDTLTELKKIPNESIDCIITSPPYYAKRDYGVKGQIGLEKTIDIYLKKILAVIQELKRVLKKEGTFFLNLGDTYSGSHQGFGLKREIGEKENLARKETYFKKYGHTIGKPPPNAKSRIPARSMMGIPWRITLKMMDDQGWILRNDNIWHKSNALPESVKDRFSVKHEYIFFFVKSNRPQFYKNSITNEVRKKKPKSGEGKEGIDWQWAKIKGKLIKKTLWQAQNYYFNLDAVREPLTEATLKRILGAWKNSKWSNTKKFSSAHYLNQPIEKYKDPKIHHRSGEGKTIIKDYFEKERNKYTNNFVGLNGQGGQLEFGGINSKNSSYREKLREYAWWYFNEREKHDWTNKKLIGDKQQLKAGMQYKRLTKGMNEAFKPKILFYPFGKNPGTIWKIPTSQTKLWHFATFPEKLVEKCILCGCPENGIVLDPFMGSGTTCLVAKRLKRHWIGIDINPEYCEMARERLKSISEPSHNLKNKCLPKKKL